MANTTFVRLRKSDRFLSVLADHSGCLIVTHDNPDPGCDCLGMGTSLLDHGEARTSHAVCRGGAIVRAENRHMVELLQPPIELVDRIHAGEGTATILVDCGPGAATIC